MLERLKNKYVIGALAVLLYQILEKNGVAPSLEDYQLGIDILCYIVLGFGIYSSFEKSKE